MASALPFYPTSPYSQAATANLTDSRLWNLRAVGRYNKESPVVVYLLMETSPVYKMLHTIEVNEAIQVVTVKDSSGELCSTARSGLYHLKHPMTLYGSNGSCVGHIQDLSLTDLTGSSELISLTKYSEDRIFYHCLVKGQHPASCTNFKQSQNSVAGFVCVGRYNLTQRILLALNMLRLYYGVFNLNEHPKPACILKYMSQVRLSLLSERVLDSKNHMILRSASVHQNRTFFLDILDYETKEVIFVAKRLNYCTKETELLDQCGRKLCYSRFDCRQTEFYNFDGIRIGNYLFSTQMYCLDSSPGQPVMHQTKRTAGGSEFLITSAANSRVILATIKSCHDSTLVEFRIQQETLNSNLRALLFLDAANLSFIYYKLNSQVLPTTYYQFRPCITA